MKIIMAPSKNKNALTSIGKEEQKQVRESRQGRAQAQDILFPAITKEVLHLAQGLSQEELGKTLKLKDDKLQAIYDFYQNYDKEPQGAAQDTYAGVAFDALDFASLSREELEFAQDHLCILSALYGIVEPLTAIKAYRLDMANSLGKGNSLYKIWSQAVNDYLAQEDYIINLASKEYSKLVTHPHMYNLEFLDLVKGVWKTTSYQGKHMRGTMARYIIQEKILDPDQLRNLSLEGYTYDKENSSQYNLVYKRHIED